MKSRERMENALVRYKKNYDDPVVTGNQEVKPGAQVWVRTYIM